MPTRTMPAAHTIKAGRCQRVQTEFLKASAGRRHTSRRLYLATTDSFLKHLRDTQSTADQIMLNTDNLRRVMIQNCQGRDVQYAGNCLAILGRYLRAIHLASLTATDLMADFRADHRKIQWTSLAKALAITPDPAAALESIEVTACGWTVAQSCEAVFRASRVVGEKISQSVFCSTRFGPASCVIAASGSPEAVNAAMIQRWVDNMTCTPRVRVQKTRGVRRFFDFLVSAPGRQQKPVGTSFAVCRGGPTR